MYIYIYTHIYIYIYSTRVNPLGPNFEAVCRSGKTPQNKNALLFPVL